LGLGAFVGLRSILDQEELGFLNRPWSVHITSRVLTLICAKLGRQVSPLVHTSMVRVTCLGGKSHLAHVIFFAPTTTFKPFFPHFFLTA